MRDTKLYFDRKQCCDIPILYDGFAILSHPVYHIGNYRKGHTCLDTSHLNEPERVGDRQVSVQRDAAEEGDANIDVGVENEAEEFATLLAVDPVVALEKVVDPQRQRADVQQVCHGQVHQVHAQLVVLSHLDAGEGDTKSR